MNDEKTSNDPRAALVVTKGVPVAVKDLQTLISEIGIPEKIPFGDGEVAYRLKSIKHKAFKKHFGLDDHIWIKPSEKRYKDAWNKAGCKSPGGAFHLDHLHSKARAIKENYKYVVLYPCPGGPNSSAGHKEKLLAASANIDTATKQPIYFAEEIHFCKMWGCYQHLNRGLSDSEVERLLKEYGVA